jgi:threo-3-hydroxy-L-aspartate ammonia-lyase
VASNQRAAVRTTAQGPTPLPTGEDVMRAAQRLKGVVHRTPLLTSVTIDDLAGRHVVFKSEHLQKTGSYKVRGAANQLFVARECGKNPPGLVASSSGNHGLAVTWVARQNKMPAVVVVPENIQPHKLAALQAYGAEVIAVEADSDVLVSEANDLATERGYLNVHPYDHPSGIAGQGTAVLEALDQLDGEGVESVVCPVGGGGLAAGSALAVAAFGSEALIYGVEPIGADDTARSMAAGEPITLDVVSSIADALLARRPGVTTFALNSRYLTSVKTVSDEAILEAVEILRERTKQVIEPAGAIALAAVLGQQIPGNGTALVLLSGGNAAREPRRR